ncbi:MAG: MBOAT family protein [Euryarchaeota archaeon]|nr:MBOAT family protein [Euryarchaeota archaeon]
MGQPLDVHHQMCRALFNDFCFLGVFLPITLFLFWIVASKRWRLGVLIASGLTFYSLWDVRFAGLLLAVAAVDYALGGLIARAQGSRRLQYLSLSIAFNLGILVFFKYAGFVVENATTLLSLVGTDSALPHYEIVLPVGISFFTFKSLSYTIDVYRKTIQPTHDLLSYLAFITLFADLVAGPIVRFKGLSSQLSNMGAPTHVPRVVGGVALFSIGLAKKVIVADGIAPYVDQLWASPASLDSMGAALALVGFGLQLYFDFSGYSDMAIGLGRLVGLELPINFRAPYQARNPSDFWRRWHISLSSWLRDYLYYPLGGNRLGWIRTVLNLVVVMAIGGLWHGAGWVFFAWGVYHGALLATYHVFRRPWDAAPVLVQRFTTYAAVTFGWVFFRATDLTSALFVIQALFALDVQREWRTFAEVAIVLCGLAAFCWGAKPSIELKVDHKPRWAILSAGLMIISILRLAEVSSPFLYYQF